MRNLEIIPWGKVSVLSAVTVGYKRNTEKIKFIILCLKDGSAGCTVSDSCEDRGNVQTNLRTFKSRIDVLKCKLCTKNKHNSVILVNVCSKFIYIYRHITINVTIHI
jgi:hypothetical protein